MFIGAGDSATAAFATGAVARLAIQDRQPVAAALASRGGQGGYVNAIACPDGIRSGGSTCQTGIDPAGAGLALLSTSR